MRILVASGQWFPDVKGGSARVAADTARKLAERGHEVTVIVPRPTGEGRSETREGLLAVRREIVRTALPLTLTDVVETRRHARAFPRTSFDLLVAHQSTGAVGLPLRRFGVPLVFVYHASAPRELRFLRSRLPVGAARLASYGLEVPLALFERMAVRRAATILVLSEFSRSLVEADHSEVSDHVRLVGGGIDTESFSPGDGPEGARRRLGLPLEETLLVTARRLEPRMGIEQLLDAVRRLLTTRTLSLVVIGGGTIEDELRRLAATLGLQGRVRFVGRVSDPDLRDWYRAADLFVLPTAAYEGFGMVTAEALACGTPVVGTPVGATPELLVPLDERLVARGVNGEALAAAIDGALELAGPSLGARCREYARARFDWNAVIGDWEDALLETASTVRAASSDPLDVGGRLPR